MYFIPDNLKVHHSSLVSQRVNACKDEIAFFHLPPYAPEYNPEKPPTDRQQARKRYLACTRRRTHAVRETRKALRRNLQHIRRDIGCIEKMTAHGVS